MNETGISGKKLFAAAVFSSLIVLFLFVQQIARTGTRIVFCDVGQGNGAYVRLQNKVNILIDTGPADGSMLACLGRHLPFYERRIDYVIISHPQADHDGGLSEILRRYRVGQVVFSDRFRNDPRVAAFKTIPQTARYAFVRNRSEIDFHDGTLLSFITTESNVKSSGDDNERSLIVSLTMRRRIYLFTGDISSAALFRVAAPERPKEFVMEVPHHGSARSLSDRILQNAPPDLAIISVGKRNPYGHPAPLTLELLRKFHIPYKRTDLSGDIVMTE